MSQKTYPVVISDYITKESAESYIKLLSPMCQDNLNRELIRGTLGYENSKVASQIGVTRDIIDNYSKEQEPVVKEISALFLKIRGELEASFGIPMDAVNFSYQEMDPGASNPVHSDSTTLEGYPIREDGLPEEIEWSALLYLNTMGEDFEGGEIGFTKQDVVLQPKVGDLVFFKGNHEYPHYVGEVLSGVRRNFVLFFGRKGNTSEINFFEKG